MFNIGKLFPYSEASGSRRIVYHHMDGDDELICVPRHGRGADRLTARCMVATQSSDDDGDEDDGEDIDPSKTALRAFGVARLQAGPQPSRDAESSTRGYEGGRDVFSRDTSRLARPDMTGPSDLIRPELCRELKTQSRWTKQEGCEVKVNLLVSQVKLLVFKVKLLVSKANSPRVLLVFKVKLLVFKVKLLVFKIKLLVSKANSPRVLLVFKVNLLVLKVNLLAFKVKLLVLLTASCQGAEVGRRRTMASQKSATRETGATYKKNACCQTPPEIVLEFRGTPRAAAPSGAAGDSISKIRSQVEKTVRQGKSDSIVRGTRMRKMSEMMVTKLKQSCLDKANVYRGCLLSDNACKLLCFHVWATCKCLRAPPRSSSSVQLQTEDVRFNQLHDDFCKVEEQLQLLQQEKHDWEASRRHLQSQRILDQEASALLRKDLEHQRELCDYLSAQLQSTNDKLYRLQKQLRRSDDVAAEQVEESRSRKDEHQEQQQEQQQQQEEEEAPPAPPALPQRDEDWTPNRASVFDVKQARLVRALVPLVEKMGSPNTQPSVGSPDTRWQDEDGGNDQPIEEGGEDEERGGGGENFHAFQGVLV
ncbi:hypothetical protein GUITHDRAFT_144906 [Guillardia theta CCMP2712]|uniref:Uncharacterized protein n=1 Tax=Guillardia theta (strain CCMP2712) TaxID=905079 RepID=L1IP94_GUITC|nr:hypothetical protein GUITHDRAFT_144906 [Guillardia theta CCMP2712]EKX37640.1 hypothetical protein GUITHDRAFT_144906 [Guillardia theta CCMP2712]|eukprot:XP_005824620.1 hypothetical protein GUITHDRAFT_144906 [Guillardia theta CCMP2712]